MYKTNINQTRNNSFQVPTKYQITFDFTLSILTQIEASFKTKKHKNKIRMTDTVYYPF